MKTGIGVVGCGLWGRNYLRNFQVSEQFTIAGIADSDPRAREIARDWPDVPVVADVEALLRCPGVEAVAIATPAATHFECARAALDAGRHVLVAKPMTTSSRDAEALCELADRNARVLMVDHTYVVSEGMRAIRRSGALMGVTHFESVRSNTSPARNDVSLIWDLAPHDLSILDALFGLDCEDIDMLSDRVELRYPDGRIAQLHFSWAGPVKIRLVTLTGPTHTLVWNDLDPSARVVLHKAESAPEALSASESQETLRAVIEHFGDVIAGRAASLMDGHHGLRVVRMLELLSDRIAPRQSAGHARHTATPAENLHARRESPPRARSVASRKD